MPNWAAMSFHAFLLVHCNKGGVKRGTRMCCQLSFTLNLTTSVLTACECTTVRYAPVILRYSQN